MTRRIATAGTWIALAAALGGCAIQQLQTDIDNTQGRINTKEAQLADEQRTQAALVAQRDQLRAELNRRETNAAQMKAELDKMRRINDSAPVATPEQRQRHDARARQLAEAANQAQVLDQNTTLSQQEKARQLEALKEKTRKMLDLLLAS